MWSRRFLQTGLLSGVAVAALTFAGLWLGLFFVVFGDKDPTRTFANMVTFALPGVIAYPACWHMVIFRLRDYSLYRTMMLVLATFGAVSAVAAAFMIIGGLYVAITMMFGLAQPWKLAPALIVTPLAYALGTAIGVVILILPYPMVATPMAVLHRWLLLAN